MEHAGRGTPAPHANAKYVSDKITLLTAILLTTDLLTAITPVQP